MISTGVVPKSGKVPQIMTYFRFLLEIGAHGHLGIFDCDEAPLLMKVPYLTPLRRFVSYFFLLCAL